MIQELKFELEDLEERIVATERWLGKETKEDGTLIFVTYNQHRMMKGYRSFLKKRISILESQNETCA